MLVPFLAYMLYLQLDVGNIHYFVGYLRYPAPGVFWQLALGIVLGVIGAVLLVIGAVCVWMRCRRYHQKNASNNLEMGPISDPNIYSENALSVSNDGYLKPCPIVPEQGPSDVRAMQPRRMLHSVSSQISSQPSASSYESGMLYYSNYSNVYIHSKMSFYGLLSLIVHQRKYYYARGGLKFYLSAD